MMLLVNDLRFDLRNDIKAKKIRLTSVYPGILHLVPPKEYQRIFLFGWVFSQSACKASELEKGRKHPVHVAPPFRIFVFMFCLVIGTRIRR